MFGYQRDELLGKRVEHLVPESARAAHVRGRGSYAEQPVRRPMGIGLDLKAQKKDGSLFPVEISLSPNWTSGERSVIAIVRDMTEHRRMQDAVRQSEERLRQAQKLEALGRLAGNFAHEFNNLLTMILGYAELLQTSVQGDALMGTYVEKTRKAAKRASNLIRQLLAFGRRQVLEPRVLDLNAVVLETCQILSKTLADDIEITAVPSSAPAWVRADRNQIEQMMINLASNAQEAMTSGGTLSFSVSTVDLGQEDVRDLPGLLPGRHVLLTVSDTGAGMTQDVQSRIFEPFFTTREFGKGPGLGLAAVYGMVKQNRGSIAVQSLPNAGTTFKVFLPWVEQKDEGSEIPAPATDHLKGTETILLVDDQPQLLDMAYTFLGKMGYQVMVAASPEEALRLADENAGEIHLLLTDVMMPGMTGPQLARTLLAKRPAMKVLYVSGFTEETLDCAWDAEPEGMFLEKPFALEDLAARVRSLCDTPSQ